MTVIALVDTEMSESDNGTIDCLVGLPENVRAPAMKDFLVRTSGLGGAEIIGVTPLAGQRRNSWRLTVRFAPDAGLLSIRYRPELTATHGTRQSAGIDVTVLGSDCRSMIDEGGDEWHVPLAQSAAPRQGGQPERGGQAPAPSPAAPPAPEASPPRAQVLPLNRPSKAPPRPEHAPEPSAPDVPGVANTPASVAPRK